MEIDRETLEESAQRYLTLANHFRSDAPTQARFDFFRGPCVNPVEQGLLELQNAVVLTGEWFVLAGGRAYCDALSCNRRFLHCRLTSLVGHQTK
jgi:hypothetical protein